MLKVLFFVCVLSFSSVNEELQKETYSYVDQLPVSEIIHQVRDLINTGVTWEHLKPHEQAHADMSVIFLTSILLQWNVDFSCLPVFLAIRSVSTCSSLIWTQNRKLCATSNQQMSLCRFYGDDSECEMQAPPGLSVKGPP